MSTRLRRAVIVVSTATLVLGVAASVAFVRFPLRTFELMGRASLRAAGVKKKTLPAPRGPLAYFEGGSGSAVLLIHGANDQAGAWARIVRPLMATHRVILPDLPGHGDSGPDSGPLAVADLLAGLEPLLVDSSRAAPVTLVGNSLGGYLALLLARGQPHRVAHVVLVNGAATHAGGGSVQLLPTTRAEAAATLSALTGPAAPLAPSFVLDDLVRRGPSSPLARLMASGPGPVLDGRLGEITTPVTLLFGEADRLLPSSYARQVAAGLPRARVGLLPGCGHMPQRECPQLLIPALLDALDHPPEAALPTQ